MSPPPQKKKPSTTSSFKKLCQYWHNLTKPNPQAQHMNKAEIHHAPMPVRVPTSEVQNFEDSTPSFGLCSNSI